MSEIAVKAEAEAKAEENVAAGALLICVAFFCFAVLAALGKGAAGLPASMLLFFQSGVALLLLLPWALRHGRARLKTGRLPLHIVRALSGLFAVALMFIAVKSMPLMGAMALSQSTPLFIPLVALAWVKAKITPTVVVSLVIGLAGVLLYLRPSLALLEDPAALLAFAAAFLAAIALFAVHRLSETEKPNSILFHYFLITTLVSAPFALAQWQVPQSHEWLYLFGIGVAMAAMQVFLVLAYRQATAQRLAPFNYSVVVFSGLIGWLVWDHIPDLTEIAGIVLICAGGLLSVFFGGPHTHGHALGHGHWRLGQAKQGSRP